MSPRESPRDPYVAYTRRFFRRWLPVYDLFAAVIGPAYRRLADRAAEGRPRRVLDLCTGTGQVALRLHRRGLAVVAVDLTPAMLAATRRKTRRRPLPLAAMDARRLAFPDATFDVATLSLALHDMPRAVRLAVLGEARRVTRERLLILDYEASPRPWLRRLESAAIDSFETAYFKPFLRDGGVAAALAEAGLEVGRRTPLRPCFALYEVALA